MYVVFQNSSQVILCQIESLGRQHKYLCIQLPEMLLKVTIELLAVWAVHTQLHKFRKKWGNIFCSVSF